MESTDYTPYGSRHHLLAPASMAHTGADRVPDEVRVESINDLGLQAAVLGLDGDTYQYYFEQPIAPGTSREDFQAGGGIELDSSPIENYSVADVRKQVQDRAVPVAVGTGAGVVIWGDPEDDSGRRMHHVYWETEEHLFGLIIDASAEQAVETARQIACQDLSD